MAWGSCCRKSAACEIACSRQLAIIGLALGTPAPSADHSQDATRHDRRAATRRDRAIRAGAALRRRRARSVSRRRNTRAWTACLSRCRGVEVESVSNLIVPRRGEDPSVQTGCSEVTLSRGTRVMECYTYTLRYSAHRDTALDKRSSYLSVHRTSCVQRCNKKRRHTRDTSPLEEVRRGTKDKRPQRKPKRRQGSGHRGGRGAK